MKQRTESVTIQTRGPGLYAFTDGAERFVRATAITDGFGNQLGQLGDTDVFPPADIDVFLAAIPLRQKD